MDGPRFEPLRNAPQQQHRAQGMDSEEQHEISELRRHGRPETTRGPYYHKAWWEAYKGDVKGTLGGVLIGGIVGTIIGGSALGLLGLAGVEVAGLAALTVAASAAFGMYKGATKFAQVGVTAGAVAATQEVAEVRMKEYIREKFREIKNEIRTLKGALTGTQAQLLPEDSSPVLTEDDFRTSHCDEHCENRKPYEIRRYVYPTVMAIGTAVGAATGAVFGFSGTGEHVLTEVLNLSLAESTTASIPLATTLLGASVGASFGLSRDWFRAVFDVTDRWFMGVVGEDQIACAPTRSRSPTRTYTLTSPSASHTADVANAAWQAPTQRVLMSPSPDVTLTESPILSATHHRDKLANAARQALLGMDHTTAMRQ